MEIIRRARDLVDPGIEYREAIRRVEAERDERISLVESRQMTRAYYYKLKHDLKLFLRSIRGNQDGK